MDALMATRAGVFSEVFVVGVGVGVDGKIATTIVSKIGIGIHQQHDQDVAVPGAHVDSTGSGHDRIVRLRDLQAEM